MTFRYIFSKHRRGHKTGLVDWGARRKNKILIKQHIYFAV